MLPAEVVQELRTSADPRPFKALNAAMDQPEAVIPGLLDILQEVVADPGQFAEDTGFTGHLSALFLLAQFREVRAFPLVLAFLRLPEELQQLLMGDLENTSLASILASTCGGDPDALTAVAEDPSLDPFDRGAAMDALTILAFQGLMTEDRLVGCFRELFAVWEARGPEEDGLAWAMLACAVADARLLPLLPRLEAAFLRGDVDLDIITRQSVQESLDLNAGHSRRSFLRDRHLVEDAILEWDAMQSAALDGEDPEGEWLPEEDDCLDEEDDPGFVPVPAPSSEAIAAIIARQGSRGPHKDQPSRNGPCPCGSGKKFKRCCGKD
jgi:hypothetical protein